MDEIREKNSRTGEWGGIKKKKCLLSQTGRDMKGGAFAKWR